MFSDNKKPKGSDDMLRPIDKPEAIKQGIERRMQVIDGFLAKGTVRAFAAGIENDHDELHAFLESVLSVANYYKKELEEKNNTYEEEQSAFNQKIESFMLQKLKQYSEANSFAEFGTLVYIFLNISDYMSDFNETREMIEKYIKQFSETVINSEAAQLRSVKNREILKELLAFESDARTTDMISTAIKQMLNAEDKFSAKKIARETVASEQQVLNWLFSDVGKRFVALKKGSKTENDIAFLEKFIKVIALQNLGENSGMTTYRRLQLVKGAIGYLIKANPKIAKQLKNFDAQLEIECKKQKVFTKGLESSLCQKLFTSYIEELPNIQTPKGLAAQFLQLGLMNHNVVAKIQGKPDTNQARSKEGGLFSSLAHHVNKLKKSSHVSSSASAATGSQKKSGGIMKGFGRVKKSSSSEESH